MLTHAGHFPWVDAIRTALIRISYPTVVASVNTVVVVEPPEVITATAPQQNVVLIAAQLVDVILLVCIRTNDLDKSWLVMWIISHILEQNDGIILPAVIGKVLNMSLQKQSTHTNIGHPLQLSDLHRIGSVLALLRVRKSDYGTVVELIEAGFVPHAGIYPASAPFPHRVVNCLQNDLAVFDEKGVSTVVYIVVATVDFPGKIGNFTTDFASGVFVVRARKFSFQLGGTLPDAVFATKGAKRGKDEDIFCVITLYVLFNGIMSAFPDL